jgi:hypothetical protein
MDTFRHSARFQSPQMINRKEFATSDYNLIDKLLHWLGSRLIWPIIGSLMPSEMKRLVKRN